MPYTKSPFSYPPDFRLSVDNYRVTGTMFGQYTYSCHLLIRFDFKGTESVNVPPFIGGVPGLGIDYFRLNWNGYKAIKAFVEEKGL